MEHETTQSKYDLEALIYYNLQLPSSVWRDQKLAAPDIKENGDFNVKPYAYRIPSTEPADPTEGVKIQKWIDSCSKADYACPTADDAVGHNHSLVL